MSGIVGMRRATRHKPSIRQNDKSGQSVEDKAPTFDMKDVGGGQVWLRANQAVAWDTATKIMTLLKGPT